MPLYEHNYTTEAIVPKRILGREALFSSHKTTKLRPQYGPTQVYPTYACFCPQLHGNATKSPQKGAPETPETRHYDNEQRPRKEKLIMKNYRFEKMGTKTAPETGRQDRIRKLVAGAGFEPATFGL